MPYQKIPLNTSPDQTFQITLPVDGKNITLEFNLKYNEIAEYWIMKITDTVTNTVLLDSIPLLPGDSPANNILEQYSYLGIGSAYIVKASNSNADYPNSNNLGTEFLLAWGDTI
ncbi:MAG: hypothetical protein K0R78_3452 [Pelosinus sp.]|jgi:hypothetical protein|nr:hypothetical protein [Pelosinus sp.]